jgi:hypothetical protein
VSLEALPVFPLFLIYHDVNNSPVPGSPCHVLPKGVGPKDHGLNPLTP